MITIKYIPDIFTLEGRRAWRIVPDGRKRAITVADVNANTLDKYGDIWVDGMIVRPEDYEKTILGASSEVVLYRRPGMPFLALIPAWVFIAISIAFTIVSTVASILMAPDAPDTPMGANSQNFRANRNYGWGGVSTEYNAGTMVPIPYGRLFSGGKVISQRIHTGVKYNQRLDLLLLLGEGPIRGIRNEDNTGICPWTRMRVEASAAATTLELDDTREMVAGTKIEVELDNGQMHESTIDSITDHNTLVLDDAIPTGRSAPVDGYVFTYPDPYIKLDANYLGNLKTAKWYFRPGTLDQPNIEAFQDTYSTFADTQEITYVDEDNNPEWYEVSNIGGVQGIDALELNFVLPQGLYAVDNATGNLVNQECKIRIQYKPHADSWASAVTIDKIWEAKKTGATYRKIRLPEDGGYFANSQYDFRVVRLGPIRASTKKRNGISLHSYVTVNRNAFNYPGSAVLAITARASDQLSSSTPNVLIHMDGRSLHYYNNDAWSGAERWDTREWFALSGVTFTASTKIILKAGSNFSGKLGVGDKFTVDGTANNDGQFTVAAVTYGSITTVEALTDESLGNSINIYSEEGNIGRNLAWQAHDFIYNTVYGLGNYLEPEWKQSDKFEDVADYANELVDDGQQGMEARIRSDVIIDGGGDGWDILKELLAASHCFPVVAGGTIWPVIEKPRSPVLAIGMASVARDSDGHSTLTEMWKSVEESPNLIEVQYFDGQQDGLRDVVQYPDEGVALTPGKIRKHSTVYHSVTRRSQAKRLAKYHYLVGQNITAGLQFSTGEEAIGLQPGDVFYFSHDVPKYDYSGRIYRVRSTTVMELDNDWDDVAYPTHSYKLLVKSQTEVETVEGTSVSTMELEDVIGVDRDGERLVITLDSAHSFTVVEGDEYILVEDATLPKQYVCTELSRDEELNRVIRGTEYNEDIYSYTDTLDDTPVVEGVDKRVRPGNPTDLRVVLMNNQPGFYVSASLPTDDAGFDHARIYVTSDSEDNDDDSTQWDDVSGPLKAVDAYPLRLASGGLYQIKVATYSASNIECETPVTQTAMAGLGEPEGAPPRVRGLQIQGQGNNNEFPGKDCKFEWKLAADFIGLGHSALGHEGAGFGQQDTVSIIGTVIEILVDSILVRTDYVPLPGNTYEYTFEKNVEDNITAQRSFTCRARYKDIYNRLGEPTELAVTNPVPAFGAETIQVENTVGGIRLDWSAVAVPDTDLVQYQIFLRMNTSYGTYEPPAGETREVIETVIGDWLSIESVSGDCTTIVLNDPRFQDAFDEVGALYFLLRPWDSYGAGTGSTGGVISTMPRVITQDLNAPERIRASYVSTSQIKLHYGKHDGTAFNMPTGVSDGLIRLGFPKKERADVTDLTPQFLGKQNDDFFVLLWAKIESGNFAPFSNIRPGEIFYHKRYNVLASASPAAQTWTEVDLSSYVPTVTPAAEALLHVRAKKAGAAEIFLRPGDSSYSTSDAWVFGRTGTDGSWSCSTFWMPTSPGSKIDYYFDNTSPDALYIDVLGFRTHPEVN